MSIDELRVRLAQAFWLNTERLLLSGDPEAAGTVPPSPERTTRGDEGALQRFRERAARVHLIGFRNPAATAAELRCRWPAAQPRIVAAAERVLAGRFSFLGREELHFRDPIDWRLDPVSGKRTGLAHWSRIDHLDPAVVGEYKITWELNRQQHLLLLGQAYACTGDERFARGVAAHLRAWIQANPWRRGINWSSSLELAFRCITWIGALHLVRESSELTSELFSLVLDSLRRQGRHVERYLSTYFSPNTHLTGEALGLLYLGVTFPEFTEAARWRRRGRDILVRQIERQVQSDGVYFEQSSAYQRYTADFYLHLLLIDRAHPLALPPQVSEGCRRLLDHLLLLTQPDYRTPLIGDDDGGRLFPLDDGARDDFRSTLALGAALLERSDYRFVASGAPEELLWLLGPEGVRRYEALAPREPASASAAFPDGGYYLMRSGWTRDADYTLVDCGPHGMLNCGHAHSDALSLVLSARGHSYLVDPGTHTYLWPLKVRHEQRLSQAHNTATVDGCSASLPDRPFHWSHITHARTECWVSTPRFDYFAGTHDGFRHLSDPVAYRRSVLYLRGEYWVIRDRVEAEDAHTLEAHFHLAPGLDLAPHPLGGHAHPAGASTHGEGLWLLGCGPDLSAGRGSGPVSTGFGTLHHAPVLTLRLPTRGVAELFTLLLPAPRDEPPRFEAIPARGGRCLRILSRDRDDLLLVRNTPRVEAAGFATDFDWLLVRRDPRGGAVLELLGVHGSLVWFAERALVSLPEPVESFHAGGDSLRAPPRPRTPTRDPALP